MTHTSRRARLAEALREHEAAAVLVTWPVNVRYLTGLASSNATVLVTATGEAALATDSRYLETARAVCSGVEVIEDRDVAGALLKRGQGAARVAVEADHMPVGLFQRLAAEHAGLVPVGGLVEAVRAVKDEGRSRRCGAPARSPMRRSPWSWSASPPASPSGRSPGGWRPPWSSSAPTSRPSTPSWRAAPTARSRTTRPRTGRSSGATW
ncbi:hypothetical protein GCM10027612_38500 [Microbispora bryophytorum subsp. camponoti]